MWAATVTAAAPGRRGADRCCGSSTAPTPGCGRSPGGEQRRLDLACTLMGDPGGGAARRADDRARPREPPRRLEPDPRAARPRRDRAAHHALPRGGRGAGRPARRSCTRAGSSASGTPARSPADHPSTIRFETPDDPLPDRPPAPPGRAPTAGAPSSRPTTSRTSLTEPARLGRRGTTYGSSGWRRAPPASSRSSSTIADDSTRPRTGGASDDQR